MPRKKTLLIIGLCLFVAITMVFLRRSPGTITMTSSSRTRASIKKMTPGFNRSLHSIDQLGSPWWIVDKRRSMPAGYVPADLVVPGLPVRANAADDERLVSQLIVPDLSRMFAAAKQQGINLILVSGYRSYQLQVNIYDRNVKQSGQVEADRVSAKPGTSEHQTGLALDVGATSRKCEVQTCFRDMAEGKWVADHAYEYGFIVRYPPDKEFATGYDHEPWHIRYVGPELAGELHRTGLTVEEFFGL